MKWLVAALLGCTIFACSAQAKTPPGGWGAADLRAAEHYWGTNSPPNCATMKIEWGVVPPAWPEREAAAIFAAEPGMACEMWIGPGFDVYEQCVAVVHEYSHWMGYGWGEDPNQITFDGATGWNPPIIGACSRLSQLALRKQ